MHSPLPHSSTPRRWRGRVIAAVCAVAVMASVAVPAGAQSLSDVARTGSSTTTTVSPSTSTTLPAPVVNAPTLADLEALAGGAPLTAPNISTGLALSNQFRSLSAALVAVYAVNSGLDVSNYLSTNRSTITSALGQSASPATMGDLDAAFSQRLGLDGGDLNEMLASLTSGLNSPDGAMASAAVTLAARLAQVPLDNGASLTAAGSDGLLFALFANRSMANFAGNFPDLFSQVSASGLGTAEGVAAWNASRSAAASTLTADLSGSMLNPCGVALLGAMASGSVTGVGSSIPGCSSCVTAGAYMHSSMNRLTNPDAYATLQIPDGSLTPQEWGSLSDWQRNSILQSNPGLADALAAANSPALQQRFSSASSDCSTAQAGTTNYLSSNLGSMFSRLAP